MSTFTLSIISDTKIIYSGKVRYCGIVSINGAIGFEANHEPFMGILKPGSEIEYIDENGTGETVTVEDGMLKFTDNQCSIIVSV